MMNYWIMKTLSGMTLNKTYLKEAKNKMLNNISGTFDISDTSDFNNHTIGVFDEPTIEFEYTAVPQEFIYVNDRPEPEPVKPFKAPPKIGRNKPCPCDSGKKYKKCCINKN